MEYCDNYQGGFVQGRDAYGETNDCSVVSVATAFQVSYDKAHRFMTRCGRVPRKGAYMSKSFHRLTHGVCTERRDHKLAGKNITLGRFCKEYPRGRFIVVVRGHALVVIDGVIHDHSFKPRRHVRMSFEITGELPEI